MLRPKASRVAPGMVGSSVLMVAPGHVAQRFGAGLRRRRKRPTRQKRCTRRTLQKNSPLHVATIRRMKGRRPPPSRHRPPAPQDASTTTAPPCPPAANGPRNANSLCENDAIPMPPKSRTRGRSSSVRSGTHFPPHSNGEVSTSYVDGGVTSVAVRRSFKRFLRPGLMTPSPRMTGHFPIWNGQETIESGLRWRSSSDSRGRRRRSAGGWRRARSG